MIKFILEEGAKLPVLGSSEAAGLDIHCIDAEIVPAGGRVMIHTGVTLASCPKGIYLRIAPRSKLAKKFGLDVLAGVVDSDYRGEICVILQNHGVEDVEFDEGSAIAQLIPTLLLQPEPFKHLVEETTEVEESNRGEDGIKDEDVRL